MQEILTLSHLYKAVNNNWRYWAWKRKCEQIIAKNIYVMLSWYNWHHKVKRSSSHQTADLILRTISYPHPKNRRCWLSTEDLLKTTN